MYKCILHYEDPLKFTNSFEFTDMQVSSNALSLPLKSLEDIVMTVGSIDGVVVAGDLVEVWCKSSSPTADLRLFTLFRKIKIKIKI